MCSVTNLYKITKCERTTSKNKYKYECVYVDVLSACGIVVLRKTYQTVTNMFQLCLLRQNK